jgi:cytochrome c oxidase subunit 1/cytochrome c oxidase subunit I+III
MWDQPELHRGPQRPEDGAYVLADGHETLGTSMLDATPQTILRMPHESPWPVALTVALMASFYGLLIDAYVFAGLGAVACMAAIAGWFWPTQETQET